MSENDQAVRLHAAVHGEDKYFHLLTMILERQDVILEKVDALDSELSGHMTREERVLGTWMDSLPRKIDGSPDVEGHRDYHQELIEEARSRKTMWRELRTEIVKKGTWGIVMVIAALIVYWWNGEVKR